MNCATVGNEVETKRVVVSAVSAKMGGAANYIVSLARELEELGVASNFTFLVPPERGDAIQHAAPSARVKRVPVGSAPFWKRLWYDQVTLRRFLRRERADVLFSTANFAQFYCPCMQVLLVRNVTHFSNSYISGILPNRRWHSRLEHRLRRWLICRSAKAAHVVMTPSRAMLDQLAFAVELPDEKTVVNHYGTYLSGSRGRTLSADAEARLLYPSLYAEHKNIGVLFRAVRHLAEAGANFKLVTPADPRGPEAKGASTRDADALLVDDPRAAQHIEFTGAITADKFHASYQSSDVVVYPSIVESFGHPLLEAMASGVPVVAADAAVNREICGDAALYFAPADALGFAHQILRALQDAALRSALIDKGLERAKQFTWSAHALRLLTAMGAEPLPASSRGESAA